MGPIEILLVALVALLLAIIRFRIHPFLALVTCSVAYGLGTGLQPEAVIESFLGGFGGTLKWIGVVIVLGAVIGELLGDTGATLKIAKTILGAVGRKRLPLAMGITGYVVSIPAFVDVAYIMLKPVLEVLAVRGRRGVLVVGLSLTAGLTASHALLPPTPGPIASAGILHADLGRVLMLNLLVAACAMLGGLAWAVFYCSRVTLPYDKQLQSQLHSQESRKEAPGGSPSTASSFLPIMLPLILIGIGAFIDKESTSYWSAATRFLGTPVVALLLGVAAATFLLRRGDRMNGLNRVVERAIEKSAVVILITGAGGGFGGVIKAVGVGDSIATAFAGLQLPSILFPFLLAMALTTATGSLTVSMVTSSSVVASMLGSLGLSPELAVASIGAGSLCVIHANSSFFWLLSRLHQVPPQVLYRTYSVQSLCMGLGGLTGVLILKWCGVT